MAGFVLKRIAGYLATLAVATTLIFLSLGLPPANPRQWSAAVAPGFASLLHPALAVSLPLLLLATILAAVIGMPLGVLAGRWHGTPPGLGLRAVIETGAALPALVLGLLVAAALAGRTPIGPLASLLVLLPYALAAALPTAAGLALSIRDAIAEVDAAGFIRTAEAGGMSHEGAMLRHGRRSIIALVLARLGPQWPLLIGGAFVVELLSGFPGVAAALLAAIDARDLAVMRAGTLLLAAGIATALLLTDLARALLDPRATAPLR